MPVPTHDYLSVPKAAAVLGLSPHTLRAAIRDGIGPTVTCFRKFPKIRRDLLAAWAQRCTAMQPADAAAFDSAADAVAAVMHSTPQPMQQQAA